MANERLYTSRRQSIVTALVEALKVIDGTGNYVTNVYNNVHPRLKFWDEVEEYRESSISGVVESLILIL